jgi:hypothetical protein
VLRGQEDSDGAMMIVRAKPKEFGETATAVRHESADMTSSETQHRLQEGSRV